MKNYNLSLWAWIAALILVIPTYPASAHPGATNAEGCHTNRKTGEYHCHQSHSKKDAKEAIVSPKPADSAINHTSADIARTSDLLKLDYEGFTVWLDCSKRGAVKFRYNAQHDSGSFKRYQDFFLDPNVPAECQQKSTKGYGHGYDRGHQVPANHLDSSDLAIRQSNTMANVLPQTSQMNRGAWLLTEEIIECYRDIDELLVIGGVIWGNNPADDYFVASHGVKTPDAFWKVIIRGAGQDERAIAWIVPNSTDASKKNLDHYLVTIDEIEAISGEKIPVADYAKHEKPSASWIIPRGCNKG